MVEILRELGLQQLSGNFEREKVSLLHFFKIKQHLMNTCDTIGDT